jgi:acyl carrier protein
MPNEQSDHVMSVIAEVFAPTEVAPESTFDDLGVTSVMLLRLMVSLQRECGAELDVIDMFSVDDVGALVRLVEERSSRSGLAST